MPHPIAMAALAAGLCFTDVPHPNPQPPRPKSGVIRPAVTPDEIANYKAWYDHWRKSQFIRVWHECPPKPGGCLITMPPPERSDEPMPDPRHYDRPPVSVPAPGGIAWMLPMVLVISATVRLRCNQ